jgi:hypothetical protein
MGTYSFWRCKDYVFGTQRLSPIPLDEQAFDLWQDTPLHTHTEVFSAGLWIIFLLFIPQCAMTILG